MANRIILNQTSYHGAGAIKELPTEVKSRGLKKALICCGPTLLRHGVIAHVTDVLDSAELSYEIYSDIKPNPTIENVTDGVAAFKAAGADYLIAIGGGSPMDTSKAIGIIINNPEFADVRSLEGVASDQEARRAHHCRPDHRRYRRRSHHQLRHHRRREEAQVRLRRSPRHPRRRHRRSRDDELDARRV